uniref:Uncharacterized protein n=1 Tax=uncultured Desulfobacterium sp. TaxID=201089 RepID=E1YI88_9BACT|nr:unknown protein [uncultured Desulfobacterium sp.]
MADKKVSLRNFIYRELFKAALLPLFVIAVTLLSLYFIRNRPGYGSCLGDSKRS